MSFNMPCRDEGHSSKHAPQFNLYWSQYTVPVCTWWTVLAVFSTIDPWTRAGKVANVVTIVQDQAVSIDQLGTGALWRLIIEVHCIKGHSGARTVDCGTNYCSKRGVSNIYSCQISYAPKTCMIISLTSADQSNWRRPHRIIPYPTCLRYFLGLRGSLAQTGSRSVQPCLYSLPLQSAAARQTHYATGTSVTIAHISWIRCGLNLCNPSITRAVAERFSNESTDIKLPSPLLLLF